MKRLLSAFLAIFLLVFFVACDTENNGSTSANDLDAAYTVSLPQALGETNFVQFTMENGATFVIELFPEQAPLTVQNFKALVAQGFYDGLDFYRLDDHIVQGGATADVQPDAVTGEFSQNGCDTNTVSHTRGTISMVRNATDYNSARCRFFIIHKDMTSLDGYYAAFGRVVAGMETVDAIAASEVTEQTHSHEKTLPVDPPVIERVYFVDYVAETAE